uniref:Pyruvate phosphate dikinase AMP/ATP-binding domain-containing protein n=1 Tax=Pyramimonas obovata TaxID=1411642 RepID=A0A7S0RVE0_9CHLO|mmetsp:Transcript_7102/g.14359  ORF Transcript_7102/g.14359 Transcript_7102/m.14359 type:complete len:1101 (+) Transcript_7102:216-3518(+)
MSSFTVQACAVRGALCQSRGRTKNTTNACIPRRAVPVSTKRVNLQTALTSVCPRPVTCKPIAFARTPVASRRAFVCTSSVAVGLGEELWVEDFNINDAGTMKAVVYERSDSYLVELNMTGFPASTRLHWSVNDWNLPDSAAWPAGTEQVDEKAVQTPFTQNPMQIVFPKEGAPSKMVFVLKVVEPKEEWYNNGNCFIVNVKAPDVSDIFTKALDAEANWSTYTLMARYQLAMELMGQAEKVAGGDAMGFIYTWLRMSSLKLLDWYRNGNYQSKDMGWCQKSIAEMLHGIQRGNEDGLNRHFAHQTLGGMSRGGGDSEAIRLEILNILRKNGIREGHRPGIECQFLEGWHQKLHSNTTVEDIAICEAYIHFQCCGDPGQFWWHLFEYGGITREMMANMKCGWRSDGIKADPVHIPHIVDDMKHYLWILKTVHAGSDLQTMVVMSQGNLDEATVANLWEIVNNRDEWWVAGKTVETREMMAHAVQEGIGGRDVAILDCQLEKFARLAIERSDFSAMSGEELVEVCELIMRNGVITAYSEEIGLALGGWRKMRGTDMWGGDAAAATATVERTGLALASFMDKLYAHVQPHAEAIGKAANVDEKYILNFGEEAVRGHPLFILSMALQYLTPMLRSAAGMSPWQVVSASDAVTGTVMVADLASVQGQTFDSPVILVSGPLGGLEDIPAGIVGLVVEGNMDVLSHVAIRARNQKVLCVSCAEGDKLGPLRTLDGQAMTVGVDSEGKVSSAPATAEALAAAGGAGAAAVAGAPVELRARAEASVWAAVDTTFTDDLVGGKGLHLSELKTLLPETLAVPASVALPFGAFERCCADPANLESGYTIDLLKDEALAEEGIEAVRVLLEAIQAVVTELVPPEGLQVEVEAAAAAAGLGELDFGEVWTAVTKVWASQWGERAWLSRRAMGLSEGQLRMSVLLQKVVPAKYAFVLHTANPLSGNTEEMLGEVVVGLGETLVSGTPGRALTFTCAKDGSNVKIVSKPSKHTALYPPSTGSLIARSDSNAEDLEGFAGAGLYDSVLIGEEAHESVVDYCEEPLLWDQAFVADTVAKLAAAGAAVEAALGGVPQDVEGAVDAEGKVHIVQARPEIL